MEDDEVRERMMANVAAAAAGQAPPKP
jgi:hypothetical protein